MIVPIVGEKEWLGVLNRLPAFDPGEGPLLLIVPHPDDETLAAGGLLTALSEQGRQVLVIAVTDGENAYADNDGLRAVRIREQEAAVRALGLPEDHILRLGLPDSGVSQELSRLEELLEPHVTADTHILAPWLRDYHPDHEACGEAALRVARDMGCRLSWYFFWTWHRGTPADLNTLALRAFPLTEEQTKRKLDALACHRSQLTREAELPILPEDLLAPAHRRFEVFALAC